MQRGDGTGQVAGFVAKIGVRDLTVQLAGRQFVHRHADAIQRHAYGIADQPGQQQGQRRPTQQQDGRDRSTTLCVLRQVLRCIVDVGFLVFLDLVEQPVAALFQRKKILTVEQHQGLTQGTLAGQLQCLIAVFLQTL
ncbi:hypothetical protein D3C81_1291420 [compost metagenome]